MAIALGGGDDVVVGAEDVETGAVARAVPLPSEQLASARPATATITIIDRPAGTIGA